jgi:ketosteroid isomerase-like protein
MSSEDTSQAERNIAVVRGFYDALAMAGNGKLGEDSRALVLHTFENEEQIQLNLEAPYGGTYVGPTDIAIARHRLHELCGYTSADQSSFSYYADGPTRVVVEATNNGSDLAGNPWSMTIVELADVVDGKIVRKQTFFEDPALLRDIMIEREAALKDNLLKQHWRNSNPLIAMRSPHAESAQAQSC